MRERIQRFGRFLSGMVIPNIGAFIAWGLITALFIPDGWLPNARLAALVEPMLNYLLPLLIGYTGGRLVAERKGAITGVIATMGVIVGVPGTPMFIGAMIAGPLGGWCIKRFDKATEGRVRAGFELLVNNFSVGIIGGALAILSLLFIGPACRTVTSVLSAGVEALVDLHLLPLTAVLVEPAKVLFLNNAINHGIFTPLGLEQTAQSGKSLLFMIESNPGPGMGLLLAYCVAGKGSVRSSAAGAAFIHFVGGIHEIYFPYILMHPILILAPMTGNIVGIAVLQMLGGGLRAAASPGSIIAELLMSPRGCHLANLCGIFAAMAVSFVIAALLLKRYAKDDGSALEAAQAQVAANRAAGRRVAPKSVRKIVFACDAGMGSSAMGATLLRGKLRAAGVEDVEVACAPVSEVPKDCQIIVTHHALAARAASDNPGVRIVPIGQFLDAPEYDALAAELAQDRGAERGRQSAAPEPEKAQADGVILARENIVLGCEPVPPEQVILDCGRMMVEAGLVEEAYVQSMIARNESFPVAIGCHVAIPHGMNEARQYIKKSGLVVRSYPDGIPWADDVVKLVIGIAMKDGSDHMDALGCISNACESDEATDALVASADADTLYRKLNGLP